MQGAQIQWQTVVVTMLFQQLVNKMFPQQACSKLVNKMCLQYCRFVARLSTSCDNPVPTTCQSDVFLIGL
jgi:hypothetical protein